MTPADRDLLGRYLADHGWEPDGHGGWYSPQQAWHVDVDIASRDHLVLSRRAGWSMTLRAYDLEQAVALLRAYRVPALPPQRCARCARAARELCLTPPLGANLAPLMRRIRALCDPCPVRADCLRFALEVEGDARRENRHGIFAGATPRQRWAMWRCNTGRCYHPQHRNPDV